MRNGLEIIIRSISPEWIRQTFQAYCPRPVNAAYDTQAIAEISAFVDK